MVKDRGGKMSQKEMILKHLEDFGSITTWEAYKDYGITRLSDRIFTLRKVYVITDEWEYGTNRYGKSIKWKKYILEGIK